MPQRFVAVLLAALLSLAPAFAIAASVEASRVTRHVLDNGLEIVVIPDRRAPVVTHMVWYKVGSADEPWGTSGIAHFLEHLMFKGTKSTPEREFSSAVARIGGQENAFTTVDYTAYYQKVAPGELPMVMRYEADRMQNLVLTDDKVLPERDVILEERRQRIDSRPGGILSEAMAAALYLNHPYRIPVIGWEHEMAKLSREDAIAFYDRFYTPNNAILIVAGDVEAAEVIELAKSTYGAVPRRAEPGERVRPAEPEAKAPRRVTYADARVAQASITRSYTVPSYRMAKLAGTREAHALDLLGEIVGRAASSRLKKALTLDEQLVENAAAWYQGGYYDYGEFSVRASLLPGGDPQEIEARIDAVLDRVIADGVTEAELEAAKRTLIRSTLYEQDSQTDMARLYGTVLATGGTVADVEQWPDQLRAVTLEEVNAAARKWLDKRRSVTGWLLPRENS